MENLQETMTAWLRSSLTTEGQMEIATYGNSLLMAQATGTDFRLHNDWPPQQWHVFLHVHEGELRLTANGDRIGFDAPVYVDFLSNARWTDVTFVGRYRACFVLVEEQFFMESTQQIRSKISEGMMRFAQSPFTPMDESANLAPRAQSPLGRRCHAILLPGPHALPRATRSGVVRPAGGAFARRAVRRLEAFLRQDGRRHPDGTADGGGQSLPAQPVTVRAGGGRDAALCRPVGLREVLQAAVRRVAHAIQKGDRAARIKFFCRLKSKKSRLLLVFRRKALLLPRNQNENTKH